MPLEKPPFNVKFIIDGTQLIGALEQAGYLKLPEGSFVAEGRFVEITVSSMNPPPDEPDLPSYLKPSPLPFSTIPANHLLKITPEMLKPKES